MDNALTTGAHNTSFFTGAAWKDFFNTYTEKRFPTSVYTIKSDHERNTPMTKPITSSFLWGKTFHDGLAQDRIMSSPMLKVSHPIEATSPGKIPCDNCSWHESSLYDHFYGERRQLCRACAKGIVSCKEDTLWAKPIHKGLWDKIKVFLNV